MRSRGKLSGVNFSFNASSSSPPGPCSNLADVVRRVVMVGGCVVARPTLMHPKRVKLRPATSQTTLRLSAKRHRTLPPLHALSLVLCLLWFPSLRHTGSTQFTPLYPVPNPSPSGLRIRNFKERRDSRAGRKFRPEPEVAVPRMAATYTPRSFFLRISAFVSWLMKVNGYLSSFVSKPIAV